MSHTLPDTTGVTGVRPLTPRDVPAVVALLDRDPLVNVFVRHRVEITGLQDALLGGRIWGYERDGELVSACHAGANIVPVQAVPEAIDAFAEQLVRGRRAASVVGLQRDVEQLWSLLEPRWGPARSPRPDQPFLALDGPPAVAPDPRVRALVIDELETLYPASVAMFSEEVGVDPEAGGSLNYRARVSQLLTLGWAFALVEDGQVLFKAEVGAATQHACQLQGVWVHPDLRGTGLSAPALAAVVELVRRDVAPVVTLYVNGHNRAARALYDRVGFTQVATFSSILL